MRNNEQRRRSVRAWQRGAWVLDALESRVLLCLTVGGPDDGSDDVAMTPLPPVAVSTSVKPATRARASSHHHRSRHGAASSTATTLAVASSKAAVSILNRVRLVSDPVVPTPKAKKTTNTSKTTRKTTAASATVTSSASVAAANSPLSALPILHSYPGASAKLYLDFVGAAANTWGSYSVPATPAYDIDGDATTFSPTELSNVQQIWARVAEKYSPFNIDVTTQDPGVYADKVAQRVVIGGNGSWFGSAGGVSYVGSFSDFSPNTSYVFPAQLGNGNVGYVSEAAAHEAGHAFNLDHQSLYNGATKTAEYNPGTSAVAPVMGNSYSSTRGVWWYGQSSAGSSVYQDDVAVIASSLNGFGYRPDDYGGTPATAGAVTQVSPTSISAAGVIEKTSDADAFTFTTGAGTDTFTVSRAVDGGMLDATLTLEDLNGNVISSADTTSLNETITTTLTAGTYVLVVGSHGNSGDIGQYTVSGTVQPAPATPAAPSGLVATSTSTTTAQLSWVDNSSNETGFKIERSDDGVNFSQVGSVGANVTTFGDTGLSSGTLYTYRVRATNGGVDSVASGTASAVTVGGGNGLAASYFSDPELGTDVLDRVDSTVNFDWKQGSPDPLVPADGFSARWSGQVQAQTSGAYTFSVTADDGVRLYVNGQLVIDQWQALAPLIGDANLDGVVNADDISQIAQYAAFGKKTTGHTWAEGDFNGDGLVDGDDISLIAQARTWLKSQTPGTYTAAVNLTAGQMNDITLEYFENTGLASAKLQWQAAGVPLQVIPQSQLYS